MENSGVEVWQFHEGLFKILNSVHRKEPLVDSPKSSLKKDQLYVSGPVSVPIIVFGACWNVVR